MRAMGRSFRRLVAAATIIAIGWGALWSLVATAGAVFTQDHEPLCHQAGMEVGIGEAPAPMPGGERKTHCPLCITALYVAFDAPIAAPAFIFTSYLVAKPREGIVLPARFAAGLPRSRAPPVS